ncbi:HEAT repeat domain-containing protein [Streptomyces sp. NPDC093510]|uniref:HEAT repeat domain-containing protein n=1 Tax=Streptomyces sp. NPDC093510 TaxID=3155199 RepID=UPI0034395D75
MFKKRRERKQAELHEELAGALRDPDVAVRAKAACDAAEAAEPEWALRELAAAVAREPWADDFHETVVDGFAAVLRRDTAVRERTERIFAGHLDDPEGFLREWTEFMAELGGPPAPRDFGEDLCDDMRQRLTYLRGEGWTDEGIDRFGRPGTFTRDLAFDLAVLLATLVVRRNEPLSAEEAEPLRGRTRALLAEALPLAPGAKERRQVLAEIAELPAEESWTERAQIGLVVDEALALCGDDDPDRRTLGIETLSDLLLFNGVLRYSSVLAVLDRLAAGGPDAHVLSEVLRCYDWLHMHKPLDEPPLALFLEGLRHPDTEVRKTAAEGLDPMAEGSPVEGEAVRGLIGLLDDDPETAVRVSAARTLAGLDCAAESDARAATDALERHAGSPVPDIRALSLRHALSRNVPDAYDRLLHELESPDAHWGFVSACKIASLSGGFSPPDDVRPRLVAALERLEASGWTDRCADPESYPDPDDLAEMLSELLERLRAGR